MKYTVQKGEHDFKPNDQCLITHRNKISGVFSLTSACWFSREDPDYSGGSDAADWNKIAGVTWFFSGNSNRSAILAWRPNERAKGVFEIAAYVNPDEGRFKAEKIGNVLAGEEVEFQVIWVADMAIFKMKQPSAEDWTWKELPLKRPTFWGRLYRHLGPWFGGNQPAHKEMTIYLDAK